MNSQNSMKSSLTTAVSNVARMGPLPPRCLYPGPSYGCDSFSSPRMGRCTNVTKYSVPSGVYPGYKAEVGGRKFSVPFRAFLKFGKSGRPSVSLGFSKRCRTGTRECARIVFNGKRAFGTKAVNALTRGATFNCIGGCFRRHNIRGHCYRVGHVMRKYANIQHAAKRRPKNVVMLPMNRRVRGFAPIRRPTGSIGDSVVAARFSCRSVSKGLLGLSVLKRSSPAVVQVLRSLAKVDTESIPLSRESIVSLFTDAGTLGVRPRSVNKYGLKYLKVPRFNASFTVRVLVSAGPGCFSSLVHVTKLSRNASM